MKTLAKFTTTSLLGLIILLCSCTEEEATMNPGPNISAQSFTLTEHAAAGTQVGVVVASDPDDEAITFFLEGGNVLEAFEINQTTGRLAVSANPASTELLDYEQTPVITLIISVTDGTSTNQATITIQLTDIEESLNQLTADEEVFELISGHIIARPNPVHAGGDFIMTNDTTVNNLSDKVYIHARLMCYECSDFESGVFQYEDVDNPGKGHLFIRLFSIGIPDKGLYEGISGTITVTKHVDHQYTLTGTLLTRQYQDSQGNYTGNLGIEEEVTFSYSGDFTYSSR